MAAVALRAHQAQVAAKEEENTQRLKEREEKRKGQHTHKPSLDSPATQLLEDFTECTANEINIEESGADKMNNLFQVMPLFLKASMDEATTELAADDEDPEVRTAKLREIYDAINENGNDGLNANEVRCVDVKSSPRHVECQPLLQTCFGIDRSFAAAARRPPRLSARCLADTVADGRAARAISCARGWRGWGST